MKWQKCLDINCIMKCDVRNMKANKSWWFVNVKIGVNMSGHVKIAL